MNIPLYIAFCFDNYICFSLFAFLYYFFFEINIGKGNLWTAGFGVSNYYTSNTPVDLKHVQVQYVSNSDCTSEYEYLPNEISLSMMCAADAGKDACFGDSGGPLYDKGNNALVGVVSWGYGCAFADYPGVYSRVSAVVSYIV
jgi:trypsin